MTIQSLLASMFVHHNLRPRMDSAEIFRHVYRELNTEADKLAGRADATWHMEHYTSPYPLLRLHFDGSSTHTAAGCGWILYGAHHVADDEEKEWICIAWHAFKLPNKVFCTAAGLEALAAGVHFVVAYLRNANEAQKCLQTLRPQDFSKSNELVLHDVM